MIMENVSSILYSKDSKLATRCAIHGLIHRTEIPEDYCGFQPKHAAVIQPLVQLAGQRLVYKKQSHGKCTISYFLKYILSVYNV